MSANRVASSRDLSTSSFGSGVRMLHIMPRFSKTGKREGSPYNPFPFFLFPQPGSNVSKETSGGTSSRIGKSVVPTPRLT